MPTAQLIDINTAAITHRNGILSGITDKNYSKVLRHLYCYNAALPIKYKVRIDTQEYETKIAAQTVALCNHCTTSQVIKQEGKDIEQELPTEIDIDKIKIINLLVPASDRLISGQKYQKVWVCPKCGKDNKQSETEYIKAVIPEPYYLQCVPSPPIKDIGMSDRITFNTKFEQWASTFLEELEEAAAKYRQEYKPKKGENMNQIIIDTSGEGED